MQVKINELTGRNLSWALNEVMFAEMKVAGEHVKEWVLRDHKMGFNVRDMSDCSETFVELITENKIGVEPVTGSNEDAWIAKKLAISAVGKTPIEAVLRLTLMNYYQFPDSDKTVFVPDIVV